MKNTYSVGMLLVNTRLQWNSKFKNIQGRISYFYNILLRFNCSPQIAEDRSYVLN